MLNIPPSIIYNRHMRRVLALVFCLGLTIVILAAWVRTYFIGDQWTFVQWHGDESRAWCDTQTFVLASGGIQYFTERYEPVDDPWWIARLAGRYALIQETREGYRPSRSPRYPIRLGGDESIFATLGFSLSKFDMNNHGLRFQRSEITMPIWAIFMTAAIYPVWNYLRGVIQRQQQEQQQFGLCPRCGDPVGDHPARCPTCDRPLLAVSEV